MDLINFLGQLDISSYGFIITVMFLTFVYAMYKANQCATSSFSWEDLVCNTDIVTGEKTASVTKILQFTGGIVGSFVVIKLTLTDSLTWDIFVAYLAYVASIDGFSKFLLARYGVQSKTKKIDTPD